MPPVAAITRQAQQDGGASPSHLEAEPGSPEALLMRIAELISAANADVERAQLQPADQDQSGEQVKAPSEAAVQSFRHRLEQVVELATQVIALTHQNPDAEKSFNNAVHYLADARLELASAGDPTQAQLLIEDADSLYERDKMSFAAAEAGSKVVELAERMARSLGQNDPEWLSEYANQTRQYADRFPHETNRAAMGLFNAGRLCDRFGRAAEARQTLEQVQKQFPETIFAEQSAGILRRLSLRGQPLELTGTTIDGGFVNIEHYKGRPVLVVFWASTSPTFVEQIPVLKQVETQFAADQLAIIGVNLDKEEAAADHMISHDGLTWPQVFSADPALRGGRNPLARYYGIQILPTYWLVDAGGIVVNERISIDDLPSEIGSLVHKR